MGVAEAAWKPRASNPEIARLRWNLLKEAVRAGATPSTTDGFHRLFEDAIGAAYRDSPSLATLLGRFKFREAKDPAEGLARIERAEKWLPLEVGRCFTMPGRGPGRVVETNFALDSVRVDFEKSKGISIPIGVASKSFVPLPEGHFLKEKLIDPVGLAARTVAEPSTALKHLLDSFGRSLTMAEVKEAVQGLVPEESWTSWWAAARKNPQVLVHGTGKTSTVEWSASAGAADEALVVKFERSSLKDKLDLFKKNAKRSPALASRLAAPLVGEARALAESDPARAFEIAVLIEKNVSGPLDIDVEKLVPEEPMPLLARLSDRGSRERLLELYQKSRPERAPQVLSDWFFKEDDARTLELIDKALIACDTAARERMIDRLLKSPRSGPRAFVWFAQKAITDETLRARLNPNLLSRLLDAISWDELGSVRTKVREMFDRTSLAAMWLMKNATLEDVRGFLDALARHHELEPHRRDGLFAAAEMRFPELRKATDDMFFVTPESLEEKRRELEQIVKVDIPENIKGIALAAAEGDLSENFEYKARREKQQLLSARAGKLQEELVKARVLDPATIDLTEVRPGTQVTLSSGRVITLLGPWDSRPEAGIYSYLSDLGKALLGKVAGEQATVFGEPLVIEKIEPWR
jgi:transcription elongation GreA/GreB family factor